MRLIAVTCLLLLGADGGVPKLDRSCKTAADCDVTTRADDCCVRCAWNPGAKASIAAHNAWCAAHPEVTKQCAVYDCPPRDPAVACERGQCKLLR